MWVLRLRWDNLLPIQYSIIHISQVLALSEVLERLKLQLEVVMIGKKP